MSDYIRSEFGGCLRGITSDGRIVNLAEELNRLEKEKHDDERRKLEDQALRDILNYR